MRVREGREWTNLRTRQTKGSSDVGESRRGQQVPGHAHTRHAPVCLDRLHERVQEEWGGKRQWEWHWENWWMVGWEGSLVDGREGGGAWMVGREEYL